MDENDVRVGGKPDRFPFLVRLHFHFVFSRRFVLKPGDAPLLRLSPNIQAVVGVAAVRVKRVLCRCGAERC